jgi:hypothetical protein
MNTIDEIFDLLDSWQHLPKYQLERRADIFFAASLAKFLSDRFRVDVHPLLIPEFPIIRETPEVQHKASCNIDYLALTRDHRQAFLIELKTDASSRRDEQDIYLQRAKSLGLPALIEQLLQIATATKHKHKYCCLLRLLENHMLLRLPEDLPAALSSRHYVSKVNGCLPRVQLTVPNPRLQVLYLQPVAMEPDEIGFAELADWLDRCAEPLALRFALSLRRWAADRAGWPPVAS